MQQSIVLREAGGIGDLVRMFPIIGALTDRGPVVWYVTSRFEQTCRLCPAVADGAAELRILKIEGVPRRASRGPLFTTWGQVEAEVPYYPKGAHPPDAQVTDLFCPAFIHEVLTGGRPTMDRLECWARHAGVWPVRPVPPAFTHSDIELADQFYIENGLQQHRTIVVSPAASVGVRSYRWARQGSLIEALKEDGWQPLVLDAAGGERSAACIHSLDDDIRRRLRAWRWLVRWWDDSGMLHLALSMGVQSVGYFGPTDPKHICGCYDPKLWRAVLGDWTPQVRADIGCDRPCYCLHAGGYRSNKCGGRCAVLEAVPEARIVEALRTMVPHHAISLRVRR